MDDSADFIKNGILLNDTDRAGYCKLQILSFLSLSVSLSLVTVVHMAVNGDVNGIESPPKKVMFWDIDKSVLPMDFLSNGPDI